MVKGSPDTMKSRLFSEINDGEHDSLFSFSLNIAPLKPCSKPAGLCDYSGRCVDVAVTLDPGKE